MLMFSDARIRDFAISVVHHCRALEVAFRSNFTKMQSPITEAPKMPPIIPIDRSRVENMQILSGVDGFECSI